MFFWKKSESLYYDNFYIIIEAKNSSHCPKSMPGEVQETDYIFFSFDQNGLKWRLDGKEIKKMTPFIARFHFCACKV